MSEQTCDHNRINAFEVIVRESNRLAKPQRKQRISPLTRLIPRTDHVADDPIEYGYRDAEYE